MKEGRESTVKATKKRENDELVSQENNNNLEKFDLEENMGVLAAHGKGVKLSEADFTVDQSMAKSAFKDDPIRMEAFPEQAGETPAGIN